MFYGTTRFDPVYIVAQIASLQCIFYITLGALLWLLVGPYTGRLTLPYLFSSVWVQQGGWAVWLSNAGTAATIAVAIALIVERAKKCLDFSFTAYFIHFVACSAYAGLPRQWQWWAVNIACLVATALTSEAICARRELRDIPIGKGGPRRAPQAELTPLNPRGPPAGRSPAKPPKPPSDGQPSKSNAGRLSSKGDLTRLNSGSRGDEQV